MDFRFPDFGNGQVYFETAGTLQSSVGVYVRLIGNQQKRQLQSVDKSINDMEKQLQELQAKRKRLSEQIASSQTCNDATSSAVIDSMFNK